MSTLLSGFLKDARVLIVDQNANARTGLKKLLVSQGARVDLIASVSNLEEAVCEAAAAPPNLVLCEFRVGGSYGLDLLQSLRKSLAEADRPIFVLVTANTSQSAVAQAAEEDVDAYILKPYTIAGFVSSLSQIVQVKLQPDEYLQLIQRGKMLLSTGQLDAALETFQKAISANPRPSLACFYEGLSFYQGAKEERSRISYSRGLTFNKIHYKCLVALFELLHKRGEVVEAYEVVRRIARIFPNNPARLGSVVDLAVRTGNFEHISSYYADYVNLEERNAEVTQRVCAALIVCGMHYFKVGNPAEAVKALNHAAVSAAGDRALLQKTIETLLEFGRVQEARGVLERLQDSAPGSEEYLECERRIGECEAKQRRVLT